MANRYTDTDKWNDDWFLDLAPVMKCVWQYLCDNVKGCGDFKLSLRKLSADVGAVISREDFDRAFAGRVVWLSDDSIWIPGTVARMYRSFSPRIKAEINVAKKIVRITEGVALPERGLRERERCLRFLADLERTESPEPVPDQPLISPQPEPTQGLSVGGSKKEEVRKKKVLGEESVRGEDPARSDEFDSAYAEYPRHEGKAEGLKRIREQAKRDPGIKPAFIAAVSHYAQLVRKRGTAPDKVKMFSSFVGNDRDKVYPWRDYVERPRELDLASPQAGSAIDWEALRRKYDDGVSA